MSQIVTDSHPNKKHKQHGGVSPKKRHAQKTPHEVKVQPVSRRHCALPCTGFCDGFLRPGCISILSGFRSREVLESFHGLKPAPSPAPEAPASFCLSHLGVCLCVCACFREPPSMDFGFPLGFPLTPQTKGYQLQKKNTIQGICRYGFCRYGHLRKSKPPCLQDYPPHILPFA